MSEMATESQNSLHSEKDVNKNRGTLAEKEPHPAALLALEYIRNIPYKHLCFQAEAFASCAIEGIRVAEICSETLRRYMANEPVSDRYILGLAWYMKMNEDNQYDRR